MEIDRDGESLNDLESLEESLSDGESLNDLESLEESLGKRSEETSSESEYEESPKRRARPSADERILEINREKYRALSELERIKRENSELARNNQELNRKVSESLKVAGSFVNKASKLELENAKAKKIRARQEGNEEAEIEADIEIAQAASALQQAEIEESRQIYNENRRKLEEEHQKQQPLRADPAISANWLNENWQWFKPEGQYYDKRLVDAVENYATHLEVYCHNNGRPDAIGSEEYFEKINEYVASLQQKPQGRRELTMNPSKSTVAPVRRSAQPGQPSNDRGPALTREEMEIVNAFGITPKDYAFYRDKEIRETPYKRGPGGAGVQGYSY